MPEKLNERRKKFADYYLELGNATQAAIKAGYSEKTAYSIGQRLLKNPEVKAYIDRRRKEMENERIAGAREVLETLTEVLRGKVTSEKREKSESGIKQTTEGTRVQDRVKAAELLGKRYGLDRPEASGGEPGHAFDLPARVIAPAFQGVLLDVLDHGHGEYDLCGGRGSTKSSFISMALVQLLEQHEDINALVLRKVGETLRDSVYAQILWALETLGLMDQYECRVSPMEITRKATGQKIFFRGADKPEKIKSIKPKRGYIGLLWFEELDQFSGEAECRSIQQSALRGGDLAWIFKSWNPPQTVSAWVNKEFRTPQAGRLVHHSTYETVPEKWLGAAFLEGAAFLKQTNPKAYAHEYGGEANGTGGNVFENVILRPISPEERGQFDWIYHGVDWGYYPDPWAYNRMYYDSARHRLYIFGELTRYKCGNRQTCEALREYGVTDEDYLVCDSAEPKSIGDYREYGLDAHGANKASIRGKGSVEYSIKWLQSLTEIIIDPETCPDTAAEFSEYEYLRDKNGDVVSGYPDADNHHIDAVRYAMADVWRRRGE